MRSFCWRAIERRLSRRVPARHMSAVLGDLFEDFEKRAAERGRLRAEVWLCREAWSLAAAYRQPAGRRMAAPRGRLDTLRQDAVHAWRSIRARPAASAAIAAVLTMGIGLVAAVFALADPFLLRPLPYPRPDELAVLGLRTASTEDLPTLAGWRARGDLFTGLAAAGEVTSVQVIVDGRVQTLNVRAVSPDYFQVLGLPVALPADWRPVGPAAEMPIVVTPHGQRGLDGEARSGMFLAHADADRGGYRVAAVLPSTFVDPFARATRMIDGFVPLGDEPLIVVETTPGGGTRSSYLDVVVRLQRGVEPPQVDAALTTAARVEDGRGMMPRDGVIVTTERIGERVAARVWPLALGSLAVGVLILLVSAANVANLLLVRGASRVREFAAREALGASRLDVARLVLLELSFLTSVGIVGGLLLGRVGLAAVSQVIPVEYTLLGAPAITLRAAWLACGCGLAVMAAGLVPAWAAWRVRPQGLFGRASDRDPGAVRVLRFGMTAVQTAIAIVLFVGASLLVRSYANLLVQDPGYDDDIVALRVRYPDTMRGPALADVVGETLGRIRLLPGVSQAAASSGPLVDGVNQMTAGRRLTVSGRELDGPRVFPQRITAEFLTVLNARVLAGRLPAAHEAPTWAVITESFAHMCCESSAAAVGLVLTDTGGEPFEIRGVVKELFTSALDQPPGPMAYFPEPAPSGWPSYVLRLVRPDPSVMLAVEREIRAIAPHAAVSVSRTMRARLLQSIADRSFATLIVVFFSVAAAAVAVTGIVGVVSFVVARRTREIAIRMAIGASPRHVRRLVTRDTLSAAALGAAAGLAAGAWLSRLLESLLYGLEPADPIALAIALMFGVVLALVAAWLPGRRALRMPPSVALREE